MEKKINLRTFETICTMVFATSLYQTVEAKTSHPKAVGFLSAPFETENMIVFAEGDFEKQSISLTFYNAGYGWNMDDSIYGVIIERVNRILPNIGFMWGDSSQVKEGEDYELELYIEDEDKEEEKTDEEEGHLPTPKGRPP